jgi:hypothetical protein
LDIDFSIAYTGLEFLPGHLVSYPAKNFRLSIDEMGMKFHTMYKTEKISLVQQVSYRSFRLAVLDPH